MQAVLQKGTLFTEKFDQFDFFTFFSSDFDIDMLTTCQGKSG